MTADFSILFAQYCERFHAPVHGVVPSFCLNSIFVWKYQLLHLRCPVPVGRPVQVSPKLSFLPAPPLMFHSQPAVKPQAPGDVWSLEPDRPGLNFQRSPHFRQPHRYWPEFAIRHSCRALLATPSPSLELTKGSPGGEGSSTASPPYPCPRPEIVNSTPERAICCPWLPCFLSHKTPQPHGPWVLHVVWIHPVRHAIVAFRFRRSWSSSPHFSTLTSTVFTIAANPSPSSPSSLPPLTLALNPVLA